jgi:glycosyltransferase involved in cell wall biosynthesis
LVAKYQGNGIALARAALRRARAGDGRIRLREAKGLAWLFAEWFQYGHWYRLRPCVWIVPSRWEFEETRRSAFLQGALGHVVPNGIDAELFRPRPQAEVRAELGLGDGPLFVSAGRLNVQKGMHYAVSALVRLRPDPPDAALVIVGEGEERGRLEALAGSLGLGDRVLLVGGQPRERVAKYLAAADVFLFPTERAESFGIVLAEAMACGVPVIATDAGAVREVMGRPGVTGLLIPPGDVDALANAMGTLLGDDGLRQRLGQAARARVLAEYTVEHMVERTVDVYRFAIARNGARSDE